MSFEEWEKIDTTSKVEKKGRFKYLSWPFAVSEFRKACPNGTWVIHEDGGDPFLATGLGFFVKVTVFPDVDNEKLSFTQYHPVLNNHNKPIESPNCFEINTSIQRCLVKAIALATGIGLHLYAGEDLPPGDDKPKDDRHASVETHGQWSKPEKASKDYPYYVEIIDKLDTADAVLDWAKANEEELLRNLRGVDVAKVGDYCRQVIDIFTKAKDKANEAKE